MKGLAITLVVAGLFLLALAGWEVVDRERHQAAEQRQLEALLHRPPAPQPGRRLDATGARARAAGGSAWGRLEIPRLGLSVAVAEGIDKRTLRRAAGHLPGTPFPGEPGNVVLAAHRDTLFRPLKDVRAGDRLSLRTPDGEFAYEVSSVEVVEPDRVEVMAPGPTPEVTLVTCYPFYYVGPAPKRYVVKARVVGGEAAYPTEGAHPNKEGEAAAVPGPPTSPSSRASPAT